MKFINLSILSLSILAAACGGDDSGGGGADACDYIPGNTYVSVEKLSGGTGPDFNWYIVFEYLNSDDSGHYEWYNEDVVSGGDYSCDGLSIIRKGSKVGSYDVETGIVTWGGIQYQ